MCSENQLHPTRSLGEVKRNFAQNSAPETQTDAPTKALEIYIWINREQA